LVKCGQVDPCLGGEILSDKTKLAIHSGSQVRSTKMPARMAFDNQEIESLNEVVAYYHERQEDPPYSGVFEERFCEAFAKFMGGGFADAVSSGTAAVFVSLAALDLEKGSEVISSPVTDSGPVNSIIMLGLTPVLADSRPDSYNIGPQEFIDRITDKTSAIIVTHSAGEPAHDIDVLVYEAHKRGIKVLEDCSQAPGATWKSSRVGEFGNIAAFSTMYRKTLASGGNGGIIFTRDESLYQLARAHADRGKPVWRTDLDLRNPTQALFPALNFTTNELASAIGHSSLNRLQEAVDHRLNWTRELCSRLTLESRVCSPYALHDGFSVFYFPIFVDVDQINCSKTEFALAIQAEGIGLGEHYGCLISDWQWSHKYLSDNFVSTNAESTRDRTFNLYVNERYGEQEIKDTIAAIQKVEAYFIK
jgi:perosamine synthetase